MRWAGLINRVAARICVVTKWLDGHPAPAPFLLSHGLTRPALRAHKVVVFDHGRVREMEEKTKKSMTGPAILKRRKKTTGRSRVMISLWSGERRKSFRLAVAPRLIGTYVLIKIDWRFRWRAITLPRNATQVFMFFFSSSWPTAQSLCVWLSWPRSVRSVLALSLRTKRKRRNDVPRWPAFTLESKNAVWSPWSGRYCWRAPRTSFPFPFLTVAHRGEPPQEKGKAFLLYSVHAQDWAI